MRDDLTRAEDEASGTTAQHRAYLRVADLFTAWAERRSGDDEEALTDLLVDLHHLADNHGIDWEAAVDRADMHHSFESDDDDDDDDTDDTDDTDDAAEQTWTFCGHWASDGRIVLDYTLPGAVSDDRVDRGEHDGGLWADSGTGTDVDETFRRVAAEYEPADDDPGPACEHCGERVERTDLDTGDGAVWVNGRGAVHCGDDDNLPRHEPA